MTSWNPRSVPAVRVGVLTALVMTAIVAVAVPAAAKGAVGARVIAGPGIESPIAVKDPRTVHELAQMAGIYAAAYGGDATSVVERPAGDLGPRYVVEFTVALSGGKLPIRQHLYPYAGGGPIVHTAAGQALEQLEPKSKRPCSVCKTTTATWRTVAPELYGILYDIELPQPRTSLVAAAELVRVDRSAGHTVRGLDHGLSLQIPDSWNASTSVMLPVQVDPVMPLAVGTAAVDPQPVGECGIVPQRALEAVGPTDAFVGIYVTSGLASWGATIPQRPKTFAGTLPWRMGPMKCTGSVDALVHTLAFEENGVKLTVLVASGPQISDERRAELVGVLDSLTVAGR